MLAKTFSKRFLFHLTVPFALFTVKKTYQRSFNKLDLEILSKNLFTLVVNPSLKLRQRTQSLNGCS